MNFWRKNAKRDPDMMCPLRIWPRELLAHSHMAYCSSQHKLNRTLWSLASQVQGKHSPIQGQTHVWAADAPLDTSAFYLSGVIRISGETYQGVIIKVSVRAGVRGMAQAVKCLAHNHEDLNSYPQHSHLENWA